MLPLTVRAQAHVNHGRWIADCARQYCGNAEKLSPGQAVMHCTNCRQVGPVEWPPDPDAIWDALERRPVPQTRNWSPAGHRQSNACGLPDGQSVADLIVENAEHEVV